jgi:hypothetical protein
MIRTVICRPCRPRQGAGKSEAMTVEDSAARRIGGGIRRMTESSGTILLELPGNSASLCFGRVLDSRIGEVNRLRNQS